MRKLLCMAGLALVLPIAAAAQDTPKVEIFGGYSYLRVTHDISLGNIVPTDAIPVGQLAPQQVAPAATVPFQTLNLNGWNAAFQYNVNSWLGLVADFTGYYGSPSQTIGGTPVTLHTSEYNYLFGPRFSYRHSERWTPFVHALFGGGHAHARATAPNFTAVSLTKDSFAMAIGGGLDLKVANHIALRLVDADYVLTRFGGSNQNNFRYSAGVVFRF